MEVKIKKTRENAVIPTYANPGDAGLDLTAVSVYRDGRGMLTYDTGIAIEIPKGYVGLVFPRSSIANYDLSLTNSVGVIDSKYRGSIKAKFAVEYRGSTLEIKAYAVGDRIAQLIIIPYPQIEFKVVDELSITERGEGGYGSSGK